MATLPPIRGSGTPVDEVPVQEGIPHLHPGGQGEFLDKIDQGEELLELNMGPQHPSTHGVLRLVLSLDGERVVGWSDSPPREGLPIESGKARPRE